MRGLLLKDIIALKKQIRLMLVLLGIYMVYAYISKNVSMLTTMLAVMCTTFPITTMSYDEFNRWDKYALSLPIQRKTIVMSKYILGIVLNISAAILVAVLNLILAPYIEEFDVRETMLIIYATSMVTIVVFSLIMPLLFKFGVEKGRIFLMACFAAPVMIALLAQRLGIPMPDEQFLRLLALVSPILVLCVVLISANISIAIYTKKEF